MTTSAWEKPGDEALRDKLCMEQLFLRFEVVHDLLSKFVLLLGKLGRANSSVGELLVLR